MAHPFRGLGLAAALVLVSFVAAAQETASQPTSSTAAHVYVQIQGPEGAVYGFRASSTGELSAIPGAPWKPAGQIIGSTQTVLFTLGEDMLHSDRIAANGAIESQIAQIPIYNYAGSGCGDPDSPKYLNINSAVLGRFGKYIYVLLQNGPGNCAAYQTYEIGADGSFTFKGDIEQTGINIEPVSAILGLPSTLSNETFAYANAIGGNIASVIGFRRESTGMLQWLQFTETDPTLDGNLGYYTSGGPDAAPTGSYVVLQLYPNGSNPPQLGSYAVDPKGNISTTNTSGNMPTTSLTNPKSTFSPSGKLFVLYDNDFLGDSIEIYNFNGAAPLTLNQAMLNGTPIDQAAWDSSNHLYAISNWENKLYVFTVTPTQVTEDDVWSIGSPFRMVLVSE